MLTLLLFLGAFNASEAQIRNPQVRTCFALGGQFLNYNMYMPVEDQVGLCAFDRAAIGSIALLTQVTEGLSETAVTSYLATTGYNGNACEQAGGTLVDLFDNHGAMLMAACYFTRDGSLIELDTLKRGYNHPANQRLNDALKENLGL